MLEARFATVRYGARIALKGVSLHVVPGECVALCGPNGAGKSTLLSALAGDLTPQDGLVLLDGLRIATIPPADLALKRAALEQSPSLSVPFTVREL
ncbi:MAG: ATP-binding cassette domain-containing protein, partial [Pseudomonadota bacterium]